MTPRGIFLRIILLSLLSGISAPAKTKTTDLSSQPDSAVYLPEVEIRQQGREPFTRKNDGSMRLTSDQAMRLGRVMGEADFIAAVKHLPNVTTAGDYGGGISVDGASPSQALYTIDGAPVIYPYRFGGIFSTFNTPHFSAMQFRRGSLPAREHRRTGASLSFTPSDGKGRKISGTVNVGLLSSSATVIANPSRKFFAALSGRVSYIDQLFGKLLKSRNSQMLAGFYDLNLTLGYRPAESDTLTLSLFHNRDHVNYDDTEYSMLSGIRWRNSVAALTWRHGGRLPAVVNAYCSGFRTALDIEIPHFRLNAPSDITLGGVRATLLSTLSRNTALIYGLHAETGHTTPQYAWLLEDGGTERASAQMPQNYGMGRLFATLQWIVSQSVKIDAGLSAGLYASRTEEQKNYTAPMIDPDIVLNWSTHGNILNFNLGWRSQYLHQVGFSDIGLASDFWTAACSKAPMTHALSFSADWRRRLGFWSLAIEAGVYCSLVQNQAEYNGQLLEVVDTSYDPFARFTLADGVNAGGYVTLERTFGMFTGRISYAYGYGRRHAGGKSWRANNDPGNSLRASVTWHEGRHWEVGATFTYADGRTFTPVKALYLIGGNLAMEYGERNSSRLPDYQRLDLSATYSLTTGKSHKLTHLVNIALLNAYGHDNIEMQYFIFNSDGDYTLKRMKSIYRFLPSLSYTLQF